MAVPAPGNSDRRVAVPVKDDGFEMSAIREVHDVSV